MITLFLLLLIFISNSIDNITSSVNNEESRSKKYIYLTINDKLTLSSATEMYWVYYKPVLKEYDNLNDDHIRTVDIEYKTVLISDKKSTKLQFYHLEPGTYYIGIHHQPEPLELKTPLPIHLENKHIIQVVVRRDNTYLGILTEQLGLPFILPPKMLRVYGHQTDLRIGTDCAELAIYGRRRMGYKIPYCGPKGLVKYVSKTDSVCNGTIIHFGFQVSVLYEDRGKIGAIDGKDLLIHAFQDKVKIEPFENTDLFHKKFTLYKWNE